MNGSNDMLPAFVSVNGSWEEIYDRLYDIFCRIFHARPPRRLCGKKLVYDTRVDADGIPEGVWHVISRGHPRLLDTERARRMPWIEPMLDGTAPGMSSWRYLEGDGGYKLYFWLEDEDYVLIFAEKRHVVALVSAFYVDKPWTRKDFKKKRAKGEPI